MESIKKKLPGILICFIIAVPSWLLGKTFPIIGGPVIAILAGMLITMVWKNKGNAETGIKWTSKIILQTAVVLLGFGMNLGVILQTGKQSLPIIVCTISTSLIIAWILRKVIHVPSNTSILVGVGSSICARSDIFPNIRKSHRFRYYIGRSIWNLCRNRDQRYIFRNSSCIYLGQYVESWK